MTIDVVRVGDPGEPPAGTLDPDLLLWADANDRVLVTRDRSTMPDHFADHLNAGRSSPGVFVLRKGCGHATALDIMVCAAHASDAYEWRDQLVYIG